MSVAEDINIIIPSSPDDKKIIYDAMKEISHSKTRQEGERDYQKEAIKELGEKFGIKPKYLRRMAKDYHKNQFKVSMDETDVYSNLYTSIIPEE